MKNVYSKVLFVTLSSISALSFADVSLYGKVAVGLENDQFQNNTIPGGGSVQDYGSYFGIRGVDPVYGENAVIWQVEQYLDISSGQSYYSNTGYGMVVPFPNANLNSNNIPTNWNGYVKNDMNTLASSETYLGLQGAWGRFRMGNLSNYMRSNMGNTNMFNCANGINCLGVFTRTSRLIPTSIRYDSPVFGGFNISAGYGFNTNGGTGISGINAFNTFNSGLNGSYSGGIISGGIGWTNGNWQANLGTMIWQQVGNYATGANGLTNCSGIGTSTTCFPNSTYSNAYASTFEVGYNDPDGLIANVGFQITSGMAWSGWAVSGGTLGVTYSPGYQAVAQQLFENAQLQTQEIAVSLGYHLGPWTPKIGYAYGNNLMVGGSPFSLIAGSAQQIANSGYQNVAAELDWNITPRTIAFVNYGQIWYGQTLQNVAFPNIVNGAPAASQGTVNGITQYVANQSTFGVGFSHTF
ncbi:MAG: porin [Neisseriaceae bacterium]